MTFAKHNEPLQSIFVQKPFAKSFETIRWKRKQDIISSCSSTSSGASASSKVSALFGSAAGSFLLACLRKYGNPFQKDGAAGLFVQLSFCPFCCERPNAALRRIKHSFPCEILPCPLYLIVKTRAAGFHFCIQDFSRQFEFFGNPIRAFSW